MESQLFIQHLGSELGLSDLKFSEDMTCRLIVGDQVVVDMEWVESEGVLQVYSAIGPDPQTDSELLHEMLIANMFGAGTGKGVLAIDEAAREVLLCREFETSHIDVKKFVEELNTFIERVAYWADRLANISVDETEGDEAEEYTPPTGTDLLRP